MKKHIQTELLDLNSTIADRLSKRRLTTIRMLIDNYLYTPFIEKPPGTVAIQKLLTLYYK